MRRRGVAASSAWAQTEDLTWDGKIYVSLDGGLTRESTPIQVNFNESKSFSYWIRLSAEPVYRDDEYESPWWIRIFVDGAVRIDGDHNGINWTPSVGWEFSEKTWDKWRQVTFRIDDEEKAESLSIFHEVWATQQWCPLHNASPITINVDDTDNTDPNDAVQTSWIVRFARTVGSQVFDAVTGRLDGGSGTHVSLSGFRTDGAAYSDTSAFGIEPSRETAGWPATESDKKQLNILPGSSFQLSAGGEQGDPTTTAWGRIGTARFDAK